MRRIEANINMYEFTIEEMKEFEQIFNLLIKAYCRQNVVYIEKPPQSEINTQQPITFTVKH